MKSGTGTVSPVCMTYVEKYKIKQNSLSIKANEQILKHPNIYIMYVI